MGNYDFPYSIYNSPIINMIGQVSSKNLIGIFQNEKVWIGNVSDFQQLLQGNILIFM